MRSAGTYLAIAGAVIIALYISYQVLRALILIPFWVKAGLALIIVGGILLFVSLIKERMSDAKKENLKEVKS